jgi:isoleucyl-tRNA synthetase
MKTLGKFDSLEIEERIIKWWETEKTYNLIKKAEPKAKNKRFFYLDGPPYTTGDVHLGTGWNKILKDMIIKYKRMRGFRVVDTPGYDTHGLPIEVLIEKKLGIKNKKEILEYGLEKFIKECREFSLSQIEPMNEQFKRLGCNFWNWDNPYITLKNTYIQGVWWTIKKAWENGYLYQGFRPMNCCPRCGTALAKHEFEYHDIEDTAIFVKFRSVEDPKTFYVIWTTTPWTLVSNTNIMANPDIEYVKMRVKDEHWIMGMASTADLLQNKLELTLKAEDGFEYGERIPGSKLEGKKYIHPLADEIPYQAELEEEQPKVHTILMSREYVQESGGSGLVHSAPGHGPEDFEVGLANGIPIFSPVEMDGCYNSQAGKIFEGKYVHEVNREIMDMLIEKGTLIHEENIQHEYAHCWRCKTKLVYRATKQWFFKVSDLRNEMLKANEEILWIPKRAGSTNFKSWLNSLQDWCISRQRLWGIPLSIWVCDDEECGEMDVIGSMEELKEKAGECPDDLHIPMIDQVTWKCQKCNKGIMKRVPDLADVWLDSGSVMWASQQFVDGYEHYDTWEPVDFILEGKDQIRGWFNSLLSSAMLSSKRKNYNACFMHGWVHSHGMKMSKSIGNSVYPQDLIEGNVEILTEKQKENMRKIATLASISKFDKTKETPKKKKVRKAAKKKFIKDDKRWSNIKGIETFRFYCVGNVPPGRDFNFDYKEYTDTFKVLNTFWNTYLFAQEKMNLNKFDSKKHKFVYEELSLVDKWILSKTYSLIEELTKLYDAYELPSIPNRLQEYILNDLSRWYITIIRDRVDVNAEDEEKYSTLAVLWHVLYKLCLMMAPLNPMISEEIYQKMFKDEMISKSKASIHLEKWPKVVKKYIDESIESQMLEARQIIDEVRSLKSENKIKLRWPTKSLSLLPKEKKELLFMDLIKDMCNVKEIFIVEEKPAKGKIIETELPLYQIYLDIKDSKKLQQERILRDLLRTIQFLRKQNKLQTGEEINLQLASEHPFLLGTLKDTKAKIVDKVTAYPIEIVDKQIEKEDGWIFHDFHVCTNGKCFAMIREKAVLKIFEGIEGKCSYCSKKITEDTVGTIQIKFKRI